MESEDSVSQPVENMDDEVTASLKVKVEAMELPQPSAVPSTNQSNEDYTKILEHAYRTYEAGKIKRRLQLNLG